MISTTVGTEIIKGISLPPNTIVGYRKDSSPIYNIAGGAIDISDNDLSDNDDSDDDDSDDDDDDTDDSDEDDYVPPTKAEWERLQAEKRKADSESAARKRLLREAGINPKTGKPLVKAAPKLTATSGDDDDSTDDDTSKTTQRTTIDAKQIERDLQKQMERNLLDSEKTTREEERKRASVLMAAVPEALTAEGWNAKALPRILKLLDLDSVDVDEDGDVDGLDEQITELKKDFPEFFKRTRMKDAAKEVADTKTVGGGKKKAPAAATGNDWMTNIANAIAGGKG